MDEENVASLPGSDNNEYFHPLELLWCKTIPLTG
jgi:hypothetical protein